MYNPMLIGGDVKWSMKPASRLCDFSGGRGWWITRRMVADHIGGDMK
jgi:hypothetical protein